MAQNNISTLHSGWLSKDSVALHLSHRKHLKNHIFAEKVFIWTLSVIEVPVMLLTLLALCFLIKSRHVASVYVIHLILSDLIQIICMILYTILNNSVVSNAYDYSLIASLYFMACIALERYLLVCHPLWYRTHHSLKLSCLISMIIWFVPLIFADIRHDLYFDYLLREAIAFLIPYPIIILCFVGTWRGLSRSISITSHKRSLILGSLFLVLLSYTFVILPHPIVDFFRTFNDKKSLTKNELTFQKVYLFLDLLLYLNPLADCLLYLFMRSDVGDIIKSLQCCCKSDSHQNSVRYTTRTNA